MRVLERKRQTIVSQMPQCHRFHGGSGLGSHPLSAGRCWVQARCKGESECFCHAHRCSFGEACVPSLSQFVMGDLPFEVRYCEEQGMARRQLFRVRGIYGATVI